VSRYYEAITRWHQDDGQEQGGTRLFDSRDAIETSLISVPIVEHVPGIVARAGAIRDLSERLAPAAIAENPVRLAVAACRPSDGASTVAAAIAIDMSQRLGLRTMLVDAHLRHPTLHRLFLRNGHRPPALVLDGAIQVRATDWMRLELATCCLTGDDSPRELLGQFDALLCTYPATIIDLGVVRLDSRMLPLARPADPVVLIVRQGQTERRELATTAAALRGANRSLGGVILNDAADPVAKPIRRFFGT
jgi:Mrp family chromosome partitioning ATPase